MRKLLYVLLCVLILVNLASELKDRTTSKPASVTPTEQIECSRLRENLRVRYTREIWFMRCLDDCYNTDEQCGPNPDGYCEEFMGAYEQSRTSELVKCLLEGKSYEPEFSFPMLDPSL